MPGKDPHKPQGKTKDMEHMAPQYASGGLPFETPPEEKPTAGPPPTRYPAKAPHGGRRPALTRRRESEGREDI